MGDDGMMGEEGHWGGGEKRVGAMRPEEKKAE
jgi:hypothetical protein